MVIMGIFPHYRFWLWPVAFAFIFFFSSQSFVTFLIKLGCSGGTEPVMNLKQNQPQNANIFLILLLFVSEWLRRLQCVLFPHHLVQGMAARSQCFWGLKIPHSVSCFAWVCSKIFQNSENSLLFQKKPKFLKVNCKCIINNIKFCWVLKLNSNYQTEYLKTCFDLQV